MEVHPLLISRINLFIVYFGDVDAEHFELVGQEELCCSEADAGGAPCYDGDFAKAGAVDCTAGLEGLGGVVVGEGHFGDWHGGRGLMLEFGGEVWESENGRCGHEC